MQEREKLATALRTGKDYKHPNARQTTNEALARQDVTRGRPRDQLERAAPGTNETTRELIENYERQHGARVTRGGNIEGSAAHAEGSDVVRVNPLVLDGDEAFASSVLHHEITHNTTKRRLDAGARDAVTVGRNIHFLNDQNFTDLHKIYQKGFRADEMEARVREIAALQARGSQTWRDVFLAVEDTEKFIKVQQKTIDEALKKPSAFRQYQDGTIEIETATKSKMRIPGPRANQPLPESQVAPYVVSVLQKRLEILEGYRQRMERIKANGYILPRKPMERPRPRSTTESTLDQSGSIPPAQRPSTSAPVRPEVGGDVSRDSDGATPHASATGPEKKATPPLGDIKAKVTKKALLQKLKDTNTTGKSAAIYLGEGGEGQVYAMVEMKNGTPSFYSRKRYFEESYAKDAVDDLNAMKTLEQKGYFGKMRIINPISRNGNEVHLEFVEGETVKNILSSRTNVSSETKKLVEQRYIEEVTNLSKRLEANGLESNLEFDGGIPSLLVEGVNPATGQRVRFAITYHNTLYTPETGQLTVIDPF